VSKRDRLKASPAGSNLGAAIGLAVPGRPLRSLVAEDRSARGAHDMDRTPACSRGCSRDHPTPAGTAWDSSLVGENGTAQVARPSRCQMDTLEPHSNDS
jgi:hypothetical protein